MTDTGIGPLIHLSTWLASMRDFSPFEFACPTLEQQYQDYQAAHVVRHVGTTCWLLGIMWAAVISLTWRGSVVYSGAPLVKFPLALCLALGFVSIYAPVLFRKHWHACAFAISVTHVLTSDAFHSFVAAFHAPSGGLHYDMLRDVFSKRLPFRFFFAMGAPLSLPLYVLVQVLMVAIQDLGWASKYVSVHGSECVSVPWPVSDALHDLALAYLGTGAHVPESVWCQVRVIFWKVQTEVIGAVFGILRDVVWRRAFLKSHPHLIGQDGAARAASWPLGSPHSIMTCVGLAASIVSVDVMVIVSWVWAIGPVLDISV